MIYLFWASCYFCTERVSWCWCSLLLDVQIGHTYSTWYFLTVCHNVSREAAIMTLSSMLFYAILSIDFFFTRIPHISKSPSGLTKPVNSRFLIFSSYIDNVNIYVLFHSSRCYFIQTILEYFSCSSNNHNGVGNISKFIQDSCSSSSFPLQSSVLTCWCYRLLLR